MYPLRSMHSRLPRRAQSRQYHVDDENDASGPRQSQIIESFGLHRLSTLQ